MAWAFFDKLLASSVADAARNTLLGFVTNVASAVNYLQVKNNSTGLAPELQAQGSDTNVDINLLPKGAGGVKINGHGPLVPRDPVTVLTNFYVRTAPAVVTISNGTPAVVSWTTHGLAVGDAVVFSGPRDSLPNAAISIANPGVVTFNAHGYSNGDPISFVSTGLLPTGCGPTSPLSTYYVVNAAANTFQFAATSGGVAINTSGAQNGKHSVFRRTLESGFPSPITPGTIYYVIAAGFTANSFQISATPGGAAINTTTAQAGKITACTGNDLWDGASNAYGHAKLNIDPLLVYVADNLDFQNSTAGQVQINLAASTYQDNCNLPEIYQANQPAILKGDTTAPWNTIFRGKKTAINFARCWINASGQFSNWQLRGLRSEGGGFYATKLGKLDVASCEIAGLRYGTYVLMATAGGNVTMGSYAALNVIDLKTSAYYSFLGGFNCAGAGSYIFANRPQINIYNNPNFYYFGTGTQGKARTFIGMFHANIIGNSAGFNRVKVTDSGYLRSNGNGGFTLTFFMGAGTPVVSGGGTVNIN